MTTTQAIVGPSGRVGSGWRRREALKQAILIIFLLAGVTVVLFPYYYILISSLREPFFNWAKPDIDLIPTNPTLKSYSQLFNAPIELSGVSRSQTGRAKTALGAIALGFQNSLIYVLSIVGGSTITSALAAYAFAKIEFPGRRLLFYVFLYSMIVPAEITLIPKYVMFHKMHLLGTYWVMIVPGVLAAGGWFLMRMFMSTIPDAYLDAARIDGANEWHIIRHVIIPMSQPVIFTYMLFTFLGVWNDLMGPLLYVNDANKFNLQQMLYLLQAQVNPMHGGESRDSSGLLMQMLFASLVISSVPTIVLITIFQKRIVQGVTITGLKL